MVANLDDLRLDSHRVLARRLIIHCDDLGMAHSINTAAFTALESGIITSASVMVPCPWFSEAARKAQENPEWDIGVHITLTSEWDFYRWSPIAPRNKVPSLVGADGYFFQNPMLLAQYGNPDEVELEIRSQIERALASGIQPTHLDTHMFAVYSNPHLAERFALVACEYKIPFFPPEKNLRPVNGHFVDLKNNLMIRPPIKSQEWLDWYTAAVKQTVPGNNQLIVHLGVADAELQAITASHDAWGADWRQLDYDVLKSEAFRGVLRNESIQLTTWRDCNPLRVRSKGGQ